MNPKVIAVIVCMVVAAALLIVVALTGTSPELSVTEVLDGKWPPEGADPEVVARTEVAIVGYCASVDRPVSPTKIRIVAQPPGEAGFNQRFLEIDVAPNAKLPDEVRPRAWTRAHGTFDPSTGRFTATRVQMKCPSAEEDKAKISGTP